MTTETRAKPMRGRPRPQETIERDQMLFELLRVRPMTRNQIRELTGIPPTKVYLSLSRLRRDGRVTICPGTGVDKMWTTQIDCP